MEEKNTSLIKSSVNSGLMLGLVLVIYSVSLFILDLWLNTWLGLVSFAILIIGVIYATKVYRTALGGFISYGQAFLVGALAVLVAGGLTTIYTYLFYTLINPEAIEQVIEKSLEMLENFNIPEEALDKAMEELTDGTTVSSTVINGFFTNVVVGVIISLISAAVMKKDKDMAEF